MCEQHCQEQAEPPRKLMRAGAVLLFVALPPCLPAFTQTPNAPPVRLELRINTAYSDADSSLRDLALLLDALPPVQDTLRENETVGQLIVHKYGIGETSLPKTFRLFRDFILAANKITDPTVAQIGPILIPRLPPRTATLSPRPASRPANARAPVTAMSTEVWDGTISTAIRDAVWKAAMKVGLVVDDVLSRSQGQPLMMLDTVRAGNPQFGDVPPPARPLAPSPTGPVGAELSEDQILALLNAHPEIAARFRASLSDQTLRISLRPGIQNSSGKFGLDSLDRVAIATVALRGLRDSRMFVLDACWPSREAFDEASSWIQTASSALRGSHPNWPARSPSAPGSYADPDSGSHCRKIAAGLKEFENLDLAHHVHVTYVPMSKAQGSSNFLRELLELHFLLSGERGNATGRLTAGAADSAKRDAANALTRLANNVSDPQLLPSSKALLEALWDVADEMAKRESSFFVINTSWTIDNKVLLLGIPSNPRGIATAAVGNVPGRDILADQVDLAQRANGHRDHIAIVNIGPADTLQCKSSGTKPDSLLISHLLVAGLDGTIPSGECETSYAAPRVAWILALDEAARSTWVDGTSWSLLLQERLLEARTIPWKLEGTRLRVSVFLLHGGTTHTHPGDLP